MKIKNLKEEIRKEVINIYYQLKELFCKKNIIFLIAIILIGLIIHFELISRDVSNPDTVLSGYYYVAGGWEVSLGRWFNAIISRLRFGLSTPMYSTFVSLGITSIAILFIIDLLEVKSKIGKALCAILLITIPSFTATLTYFYCSDVYQIAMLSAILMPWCIYKIKNKKIGIILGAIFITISMGSYQSYLGVGCGLCVIVWILKLLKDNNYTIKKLGYDILITTISIILGMILYFIISKVFLSLYNMDIASYSGANNISIINTIVNLPNSILETYSTFFVAFFKDSIVKNSFYHRQILYAVLFILIFAILIYKLIKNEKKQNTIIAIILTILLPIAFNIIVLIATRKANEFNNDYSNVFNNYISNSAFRRLQNKMGENIIICHNFVNNLYIYFIN